jgi:DNA invertase Pin-like site-specific DNA recombinase
VPERKAIGIVRVSQVKGREGDSFASPETQAERIRAVCERDRLVLLEIDEELDVSGGANLARRPGLSRAVAAIEAGEAQVIVAAYFDRFFRNMAVQREVIERVERAGGAVLTVDMGAVSHATAAQWLSGTLMGAFAEYQRRTTGERAGEAQARAVARGALPYANVPPGLLRNDDGTLRPDPKLGPAVAQAVRMRADGATIKAVRAFLAANGIARSYHGTQHLIGSRLLLGEIHFGKLVNLHAHEPVVDRETWQAAQRVKVPRGRRAVSDRLLARLGVLRCGSCGARMVVGTANNGRYALYRCPPIGDCKARVTVSAEMVERIAIDATRTAMDDEQGKASVATDARQAQVEAERAQSALDGALRAFGGLEDEPAAIQRLGELRAERDEARARAERLGGQSAALTLTADDWDRLSLEGRRALIAAVIERIVVMPGRGAGRVRVELFGQ